MLSTTSPTRIISPTQQLASGYQHNTLLPHDGVLLVHCYGKVGKGECACASIVCKPRDGLSIQGSLSRWA